MLVGDFCSDKSVCRKCRRTGDDGTFEYISQMTISQTIVMIGLGVFQNCYNNILIFKVCNILTCVAYNIL
ncbi:hypothetical protein [Clostridium lacusfryxellense]|uniref:hypothetical protein n=1 Tax=Clostridium lacusfryxellense TaxID=205328 RepID=UPI001C0D75C4|nr:hypothetical protein [Clostridium lacusfryxellense]MBU3112662.1 hypothetical protein [Clostridium lacusfryxellense]